MKKRQPATGRVRRVWGYATGEIKLEWRPNEQFCDKRLYAEPFIFRRKFTGATHRVSLTVTSVRLHKDKRGRK